MLRTSKMWSALGESKNSASPGPGGLKRDRPQATSAKGRRNMLIPHPQMTRPRPQFTQEQNTDVPSWAGRVRWWAFHWGHGSASIFGKVCPEAPIVRRRAVFG